jgi:hypothetical protein
MSARQRQDPRTVGDFELENIVGREFCAGLEHHVFDFAQRLGALVLCGTGNHRQGPWHEQCRMGHSHSGGGGFANLTRGQNSNGCASRTQQKCLLPVVRCNPQHFTHPECRIDAISRFTTGVHCLPPQCLRDTRFEFWFMVEFLNEPLSDLPRPDIDVGLYGDVHLRPGGLEVPRQSGKTVECLTD